MKQEFACQHEGAVTAGFVGDGTAVEQELTCQHEEAVTAEFVADG